MKTVFGKTFTYYIVILVVTFFMLSLVFTAIFKGYFQNDQKSDLLNEAIKISDLYIQSYSNNEFDFNKFLDKIEVIDKYIDCSFFITDNNLNVITRSKDLWNLNTGDKIEEYDNYEKTINGDIEWFKGNIGNIYSQDRYVLYYPIINNGSTEAIVVVSVPFSDLTKNINRVYVIIFLFFILAAVIGFVLIHWAVNVFVMPIRKLSGAAKHISKGHFDERIEVESYMNDEMKELCISFNTMADNLEGLEMRRREIISNISHDLRSPLTSIMGFLQAMLDDTISEDKYKRYMGIIYNETKRLNKLSNSILDLTKLDDSENALNMTVFDINVIIDEVLKLMNGRAMDKNIHLTHIPEKRKIKVYGDVDKIRRVINNLVDNAIKFTEKGSIKVTSEIRDNKAFISIEDTGVGLTKEEQTRVFERLYKADSSRGMDTTGSGLGLAIVKSFIKAHNQTIEVESKKGRGSRFTFTLDLA